MGVLTITRRVCDYFQKNSVELVGTSSDSRPTQHPPGFPSHPPPGLTPVDPSHAASMAMFSQVQAMLKKFEETFERRMAQVEARAPRQRSRSPLDSSSSKLRRSDNFSSQEESLADGDGRLASVVPVLSPGAAQANQKIILGESEAGGLLTVSLDAGDNRSASRVVSPSRFETSCAVTLSQEKTRQEEEEAVTTLSFFSLRSRKRTCHGDAG